MSACVRPALNEPSFFLYRALADLKAADNFLSALRADRDRFLTGGVEERSRSARELPSDSRSEVINLNNAMYSSGVSIMSRAKEYTSCTEDFALDKCGIDCGVSTSAVPIHFARDTLSGTVVQSKYLNEEIVSTDDSEVFQSCWWGFH